MNSIPSTFEPDSSGKSPKQMAAIPNIKLPDGHEMPMIGFGLGTAMVKDGLDKNLSRKIVDDTVKAIKAGYYHLDGAEFYKNEEELGAAIKEAGVPRENLFVTTKTSVHPGDTIEEAITRSLQKLGLDYVDLYLIHSPFFAKTDDDLSQKWADMEAVLASGRARSIGVSNYLQEHLEPVLKTAKSPPVVNQIEYHPYLQRGGSEKGGLLDYLRQHNMVVQAYAPLTAITKAAPGPVDEVYDALAKKYGVTTGDVALRWCIDQGIVALTTSSNEQRLRGYLSNVPAFKLTPKEVHDISEAGKKKNFRGFWTAKFAEHDWR